MFVWTVKDIGFVAWIGLILLGMVDVLLLGAYYCIRVEVLKVRDRLCSWFKRTVKGESDGS